MDNTHTDYGILATEMQAALAAAEQRAADAEAETVRWYDKHVAHMAALGNQGRQLRMALARAEAAEAALAQAREELAALRRVAGAAKPIAAAIERADEFTASEWLVNVMYNVTDALAALGAAGEAGDGV